MPEGVAITLAGVLEQTGIELGGKSQWGSGFALEADVIRVNVYKRQAAVPGNPVQFLKPDVRMALAEQEHLHQHRHDFITILSAQCKRQLRVEQTIFHTDVVPIILHFQCQILLLVCQLMQST